MLEKRMRKRPILEACGREGTTWLVAKPSIQSRFNLLLWGGRTFWKWLVLGSLEFPLAAVPDSSSTPSSAVLSGS